VIKLLAPGSWWISSQSDPRWNGGGRSEEVGGFELPKEAREFVQQKEKELGDPPADVSWGYWKD